MLIPERMQNVLRLPQRRFLREKNQIYSQQEISAPSYFLPMLQL
jgi:hypothetical protein